MSMIESDEDFVRTVIAVGEGLLLESKRPSNPLLIKYCMLPKFVPTKRSKDDKQKKSTAQFGGDVQADRKLGGIGRVQGGVLPILWDSGMCIRLLAAQAG